MPNRLTKSLALAAALCGLSPVVVAGTLSENIRISSQYMGYDLQYRVYTPSGVEPDSKYPVLLVTDGQWYIRPLGMIGVLDSLIDSGQIEPIYVIFVDSRNPDDLEENRRFKEFMCNADYVNFYTAELLPSLYGLYPINVDREDTYILGLSFGGLNAACFGLLASNRFSGLGMHSPGNHKHMRLVSEMYEDVDTMPLRIFLSAGTVNDNLRASKQFREVFEEKGYEVTFVVNNGKAHNWENWSELLDDVLLTFFATEPPP
jgi:enterochelin esterase-like enzyme